MSRRPACTRYAVVTLHRRNLLLALFHARYLITYQPTSLQLTPYLPSSPADLRTADELRLERSLPVPVQ